MIQLAGFPLVGRSGSQSTQGSKDIGRHYYPCRTEAPNFTELLEFLRGGLIVCQNDQANVAFFDNALNIADPADHFGSINLHAVRPKIIIDKTDNLEFP